MPNSGRIALDRFGEKEIAVISVHIRSDSAKDMTFCGMPWRNQAFIPGEQLLLCEQCHRKSLLGETQVDTARPVHTEVRSLTEFENELFASCGCTVSPHHDKIRYCRTHRLIPAERVAWQRLEEAVKHLWAVGVVGGASDLAQALVGVYRVRNDAAAQAALQQTPVQATRTTSLVCVCNLPTNERRRGFCPIHNPA